jgi:hypothetical protein
MSEMHERNAGIVSRPRRDETSKSVLNFQVTIAATKTTRSCMYPFHLFPLDQILELSQSFVEDGQVAVGVGELRFEKFPFGRQRQGHPFFL